MTTPQHPPSAGSSQLDLKCSSRYTDSSSLQAAQGSVPITIVIIPIQLQFVQSYIGCSIIQLRAWWATVVPFSSNMLMWSSSIFDHLRWEASLHREENGSNFPGRKHWVTQLKAAGYNYLYMCDMRSTSCGCSLRTQFFSCLKTLLKAQWNTNCLPSSFNAISSGEWARRNQWVLKALLCSCTTKDVTMLFSTPLLGIIKVWRLWKQHLW